MDVIRVEPGMQVGEIGAGNGRFAVKVAARVGEAGMVYANDIDTKAIRFMEKRREKEQITNLTVIRGEETEPRFPKDGLDLVYLINTYDHLSDPVTLLRNTRKSRRSGARLAVIAYDPKKLPRHAGHAVAKETVLQQCRQAGFVLVSIDTTFVYDNVYVFEMR